MYRSLFSLLIFSFLLSCQNPGDGGVSQLPPLPLDEVDEDQLFLELSALLYTNPTDPRAIAQNDLINYALDNKLDVRPTGSGLFVWILESGQGPEITHGTPLKVQYVGQLLNGKVFDSSFQRGRPLEFKVGEMIHGWNEGLKMLRPGGRAVFLIPPALAYGEEGIKQRNGKSLVPPNAPLRFDLAILPNEESR